MIRDVLFKTRKRIVYHYIINSLLKALESKDYYTKSHSERVSNMSYELAKSMGIKGKQLEKIYIAAYLHDIGKIGVPDKILNKKYNLELHEWECIKKHPKIGCDILKKYNKLGCIPKIVLYHHERWDGNGYPEGLRQLEIPLGARIIAVCDAIDAMTSERSYRKALSTEFCKNEILRNKGIMFDPVIAEYAIDIFM